MGLKEQAIEDYNQAIKLDPKYTKAYINRGSVLDYMGKKEEAL